MVFNNIKFIDEFGKEQKLEFNNIYCVDCMKILKLMPDKSIDLCIVDPPYGGNDAIGIKDDETLSKHATKRTNYKLFENVAPTQEYFDELKRVSKNQIIWGVNFYDVKGLSGGRIVWDKKGTAFGRAEMAYYSNSKSVQIFEYTWNGMLQGNMKTKENRIHPTQKPVALYEWLLNNYAKKGDKILDTHLGSASSIIACKKLGFEYMGFELDKDYFEKAKERIEKFESQENLFGILNEIEKPKPKQESLF